MDFLNIINFVESLPIFVRVLTYFFIINLVALSPFSSLPLVISSYILFDSRIGFLINITSICSSSYLLYKSGCYLKKRIPSGRILKKLSNLVSTDSLLKKKYMIFIEVFFLQLSLITPYKIICIISGSLKINIRIFLLSTILAKSINQILYFYAAYGSKTLFDLKSKNILIIDLLFLFSLVFILFYLISRIKINFKK